MILHHKVSQMCLFSAIQGDCVMCVVSLGHLPVVSRVACSCTAYSQYPTGVSNASILYPHLFKLAVLPWQCALDCVDVAIGSLAQNCCCTDVVLMICQCQDSSLWQSFHRHCQHCWEGLYQHYQEDCDGVSLPRILRIWWTMISSLNHIGSYNLLPTIFFHLVFCFSAHSYILESYIWVPRIIDWKKKTKLSLSFHLLCSKRGATICYSRKDEARQGSSNK